MWRTAIRYTSGQLKLAIGIPQQTYRHWKEVLPPLRRDGRGGPCFSVGDLLAVAVVHRLKVACGIPASAFTTVADKLFEACNSAHWLALENQRMIIEPAHRRIWFSQADDTYACDTPTLVVPLQPIVKDLRNALLAGSQADGQEVLRFPPTALPGRADRAPGRSQP